MTSLSLVDIMSHSAEPWFRYCADVSFHNSPRLVYDFEAACNVPDTAAAGRDKVDLIFDLLPLPPLLGYTGFVTLAVEPHVA